MKEKEDRKKGGADLRGRAEELLVEKGTSRPKAVGKRVTAAEAQRLVQELQIHRIELEMQNEELKQARDEAEAERERYLDLYDFSPLGYFTLGRDGGIRQANLTGARMLGLDRSHLQNRRFGRFVYEADLPAFNAFLEKVFEERLKRSCDVSLDMGGYQRVPVHIEAAPPHGEECRVAMLDVTELMRAQDEARRLHEELEQGSAEHIVQLEAANKELDSFGYSISHDLQTPLRAIDGYARMILRSQGDRLDEETRNRFNVIRDNIQKMGQLINDFLAFSRLGKRQLSLAEVDMDALVTEAWEELKVANPDRSLTLKSGGLPPAVGDRALIRQVVGNVLANAVKFAKFRDEVVVEVDGSRTANETVYVVKDNGVGFDMAYYEKLFGMFQRLHDPAEYEGTGVGLAIAQRIIIRHGGRIWAEGQMDKGATFYFSLPIREQ
jgi:signal transduction histidine kinase